MPVHPISFRTAIFASALSAILICMLLSGGYAGAADRARLSLHRINGYQVVSDRVLIIEARRNERYRAELSPGCFGLRHAQTLGFQTSGGNSLDDFSSVVLPDGSRCRFRSFMLMPEQIATPLQGDIQAPDEP